MRKNEDKRPGDKTIFKNFLFGTALGFLIVFIILAVYALLISNGTVGQGKSEEVLLGVAFIASICGGFAAAKKNGSKKVLLGICVGATIIVARLIFGALGNGDLITVSTGAFLICALGGGMCGGLFAENKKKKRRGRI